ncbi:hypothetical protein OEA41_004723 [Lepraria neglecta]|uniref:Solute carrier family 40 member n=1 Tax=Lepraria neglecta TaxID=209136 RepID=A0AAD9Z1J9_9LECA|nr:hypothetical protein OEA41_004723 [Lepraria neglecta]
MVLPGQNDPTSDEEEAIRLLIQDEEEAPPPYARHSTEDPPRSRTQLDVASEQDRLRKEKSIKRRLYISHFLSTWNSRVFEFACLLFIAHLWKDTLLPVSIFALVRSASAICFAPMVGRYVDHGDRLKSVRLSIACKLLGPLFIALVDGYQYSLAIMLIFGMNILSVLIEYFAIADVYWSVPALRTGRPMVLDPPNYSSAGSEPSILRHPLAYILAQIRFIFKSLYDYSQHAVFLPSLALSLLYLTVFSFSGQMIIYLLSVKGPDGRQPTFPTTSIGLLRTLAVTLEMLATWLAPAVMKKVGPTRAGLWAISWQLIFSWIAVSMNWDAMPAYISAWFLVSGVILSRVGLWSFDLCVQVIVQEGVEPGTRGSFSALEASLQNFFELCAYVSTIVFSRPDQFQYPAFMSAGMVLIACIFCWDGKKGEVQRRRRHGRDIRMQELP